MLSLYKTILLSVIFFMVTPPVYSNVESEINIILAHADDPPAGVVFEIVESDESSLTWAIPEVKKYAAILREKFPGLDIAVVSHGKEEFALLKSNSEEYASVHKAVKSLVKQQDIPVHICGTHASWYDKAAEDFPDYVDVSPVGPAQINDYENMGYTLVVLEKP